MPFQMGNGNNLAWMLQFAGIGVGTTGKRVLSFDLFPKVSARIRKTTNSLFGFLILALVSALLCGFTVQSQGLFLAAGIASLLVIGLMWPWISLSGLHFKMQFGKYRCFEGELVPIRFEISNSNVIPVWSLSLNQSILRQEGHISFKRIGPGKSASYSWWWNPSIRGIYPKNIPQLETSFPFGLWSKFRSQDHESRVIVWPRTMPVGPLSLEYSGDMIDQASGAEKNGNFGDTIGVRPYRRGDSPRRIHWQQTARQGKILVRELQTPKRNAVWILLDNSATSHFADDPQGTWEWCVRISASLAKAWLDQGDIVGLIAGENVISPNTGLNQIRLLLDTLASIELQKSPISQALPKGNNSSQKIIGITTDLGVQNGFWKSDFCEKIDWIILKSDGFPGGKLPCPCPCHRMGIRPLMEIAGPNDVGYHLNRGIKGAIRGV